MLDRSLASWFGPVTGVAIAIVAVIASHGQQAFAQAPAGKTTWKAPRTADGRPDLQGVWLSNTATPLERPKALEGRAFLTDAEVSELKQRAQQIFGAGRSDFAAGDAVFLAALSNTDRFKSPTSTHNSEDMIEREFDRRTSQVVDPPDGRIPPLTPEGQARRTAAAAAARRASGPDDLDNALRCIAWGAPRLGGRYGAGDLGYYQIVQTRDYVVLYMETGHEARIIPIDAGSPPSSNVRQWSGVSRGRWEGDTLVIETAGFSQRSYFMGSRENLRLVERLTRVAPKEIKYEMSFTDPTTWTKPWSAEMPLRLRNEQLYESACHEGNYHIMLGMLSAARAQENQK
jgi:hypothetical protein